MKLLALGTAVLLAHLAFLWWLQSEPGATTSHLQPLLVHIRRPQPPPQQALPQPTQRQPRPTTQRKSASPPPSTPPVQQKAAAHNPAAAVHPPLTSAQGAPPPPAETSAAGVVSTPPATTSALPHRSTPKVGTSPASETASTNTLPSVDADYLDNPPPVYPPLSLRRGEQGTVQVRVLISSLGRALRVEVAQSSGFDRLDRAALEAVMRWRYIAAQSNGVAIDRWFTVPVRFKLDEK